MDVPHDLDTHFAASGIHAVPDALRHAAYETLGAQYRGWIKTTLALNEMVHARAYAESFQQARPELGFSYVCTSRPADWTLCLMDADFAAAPRLAAALMVARLAGQENINAIWHGENPADCPAAILTALELTGVEAVYTTRTRDMDVRDMDALAASLCDTYGPCGRILSFGVQVSGSMPVWRDHAPTLTITGTGCDEATARWAQPDAAWVTPDSAGVSASYGPEATQDAAPLHLGLGLEGCWIHTSLKPDFFLQSSRTVQKL